MIKRARRALRRWAYAHDTPISRARTGRMLEMVRVLGLPADARIIDLGGTEYLWRLFDHQFEVTLVNIRKPGRNSQSKRNFIRVEADACDLHEIEDQSFDLAFSNSVIEHVGDERRQAMFASEVRRIGRSYWVQTPSSRALIEAHSGIPLYWKLPSALHGYSERRDLRVLTLERMQTLFPASSVFRETLLGLEKSYAVYCR